jgi:AcrR family transcriptional regulator
MADVRPFPMPSSERGARTRKVLLDAAEKVFGHLGYERASVSAINREAGVAQGTFYTYFRSKQEVFVAVIEDRGVQLRQATRDAARSLDPGAGRAAIERAGMEAGLAFIFDHRDLHRILRDAELVAPDLHRWWFESVVAAYVAGFRRLTPDCRPALDIEMFAYVIQGMARGLSNRMLTDDALPSERSMDQVFALLAHGFDGLLAESTR